MQKRVLGIDIGLKRTGLAVSDELGLSVRALENRVPQSLIKDLEFILDLAHELEAATIVIGYPLQPANNEEGPIAKRARGFKEALEKRIQQESIDLRVFLVDESHSSKAALARLVDSGIKKSKRKSMLDSEVARFLVEGYLSSKDTYTK